MPRQDFRIQPVQNQATSDLGFKNVVCRRDLTTLDDLKNAPGVGSALEITSEGMNETLQSFLVRPDPLYDTETEALADLTAWLQSRTVKLDGDIWDDKP